MMIFWCPAPWDGWRKRSSPRQISLAPPGWGPPAPSLDCEYINWPAWWGRQSTVLSRHQPASDRRCERINNRYTTWRLSWVSHSQLVVIRSDNSEWRERGGSALPVGIFANLQRWAPANRRWPLKNFSRPIWWSFPVKKFANMRSKRTVCCYSDVHPAAIFTFIFNSNSQVSQIYEYS